MRLMQNPLQPAMAIWLLSSIFGLVPPFSRDALNDHMVLPILWEQHGLFWRDSALAFTAYPPLGDLPYILFSGHSWDWLASVTHALGSFITLVFLNKSMINLEVASKQRLIILLSWSVAPVVVSLTTWCYVDLWLCAFAAMAMERLTRAKWQNRDAAFFGLFIGMALLVKYNGIPLAFALILGLLWRWGMLTAKSIRYASLTAAVILIVSGWWHAWNWLEFGTPLYPMGSSGESALSWLQYRILGYNESPLWAALAPIRQFFWGEVNHPRLFDGMLHPLWLAGLLAPWVWKRDKRLTALLLAALVYAAFAMTATIRARYWLPGMVMLLPAAGIILTMSLGNIGKSLVAISFVPPVLASTMYLASVAPWQFWQNGRDAFLAGHVPDYALQKWASQNLPEKSSVYLLWTGGRGYYLHRPYTFDFGNEGQTLQGYIYNKGRFKYSHVLMQRDLSERTLGTDHRAEWETFLANSCQLAVFGRFELWQTSPCAKDKEYE